MYAGDDVGDYLAGWSDSRNSKLSKSHVDFVVQEGGCGVTDEWSQENQGDDCIIDIVVCFKLLKVSMNITRVGKLDLTYGINA